MVDPVYINTPVLGKDIKLIVSGARKQDIQKALESRTKMLGRVRSYEFKGAGDIRNNPRSKFAPPIYDLAEISRASDIEPYISQSVRKHREQILKEGFQISGVEEEMEAYVKQRLFEISLLTGITTEQWLRELVTNLVTFHNAFLIFRRDAKRSSGKRIKVYGVELDPIAGIFVGDPTTMEVSVDKYGTPQKWRQKIDGDGDTTNQKQYNIEDVVHITVDKKTGFTFGTPYLLPVLDDIRALRKLEEVAIILAAKEAFPLYHYKVGSETKPAVLYEGGGSEVDQVADQVASLPAQGYIVTSERHEVKLVSREGSALDLSPYLDYFEARVVAGLRLSPLDLGRGSSMSRGTATNLNKGLQDSAKDYQQVISDHVTHFVILPLLLEGGYDILHDNVVRFTFPTIDREEERANQNHGAQLFMANAITNTEFRKQYLNKQQLSEEEKNDLSLKQQTEAQKEIVRTQGSVRAAASSSGSDLKMGGVRRQLSNKGQPANQHGIKPAKSRFKANDYIGIVEENLFELRGKLLSLLQNKDFDVTIIDEYLREFVSTCVEESKTFIEQKIDNGYSNAKKQYDDLYPEIDQDFEEIGTRALERFYSNFVVKSFWKVINPSKDSLLEVIHRDVDNNINLPNVLEVIDQLEEDVKKLIDSQLITSERFGFIKFAKKVGSKTIDLINPDTFDALSLDVSELVYKNIMPNFENYSYFLSFPKPKDKK